jgi:ribosomal protein S6--L-glutamate ligase
VLKNIYGTLGEGTKRLDSRVSAKSVLEDNHEPILIQEYLRLPGYPSKATDIRIVVIDSQAAASYKRQVSAAVDFRTNVYRWGKPVDYQASKSEVNLAVRAARALNLEIAGVDLFPTRKGLLVNELNASTGLGVGKQMQFTIARAIVGYAIKKASMAGKAPRRRSGAASRGN